jgi:hypothetical protein
MTRGKDVWRMVKRQAKEPKEPRNGRRTRRREPEVKRWEPLPEATIREAINTEECPCEIAERDRTVSVDWHSAAEGESVEFVHETGGECAWNRIPGAETWNPIRFYRMGLRGGMARRTAD